MNKTLILELIKQDINDLQRIISQFNPAVDIHPIEIELCNNKIKNLAEELRLLSMQQETQGTVEKAVSIEPARTPEPVEAATPVVEKPAAAVEKETIIEPARTPEPVEAAAPVVEKPAAAVEKETIIEPARTPEPVKAAAPVVEKPAAAVEKTVTRTEKTKTTKVLGEELGSNKKSLFELLAETKGESDIASQFKSSKLEDINQGISLNDRIWFIRELFKDNSETYHQTIQTLNQAGTLEEASHYIQSTFDWDTESRSVQKFLKVVSRRFN
ncbi:MAG: hypothetical protein K9I34_05135 [Bacteroidales bacterium]|nr:hypothetical protein [Bacteroidales bacterium]